MHIREHRSLLGSDCSGVRVEGIWAIASGACKAVTLAACTAAQLLPQKLILSTVAYIYLQSGSAAAPSWFPPLL